MTLKSRYKQVNWYENCLKQMGEKKVLLYCCIKGCINRFGPGRIQGIELSQSQILQ